MSQSGKVALVTGGAQGIGRAFVESLLAEGASVVICDFNNSVGEATVKELSKKYAGKVIFIQSDVTNETQFEDCFKKTLSHFSRLDIVINNAGTGNEREPGWRKMVDLNFVAVVVGTKLGMKYMNVKGNGKGGTIVNIASITTLEPFPSLPVYSATKAAVNQYSRSMGSEVYYSKTGVRVLSINPGMTDTPLTSNIIPLVGVSDDPDVIDNWKKTFARFHLQQASTMGRELITVLQKGQNGSQWTIDNDEPAKLTIPR